MKKITPFLTLIGSLLSAAVASADTTPAAPLVTSPQGLLNILCNIAGWMVYFLLALSTIMVLVGAFYYLTAQGDAEKVTKATKTLTFAAVGIVITLIAFAFPKIIGTLVGSTAANGC